MANLDPLKTNLISNLGADRKSRAQQVFRENFTSKNQPKERNASIDQAATMGPNKQVLIPRFPANRTIKPAPKQIQTEVAGATALQRHYQSFFVNNKSESQQWISSMKQQFKDHNKSSSSTDLAKSIYLNKDHSSSGINNGFTILSKASASSLAPWKPIVLWNQLHSNTVASKEEELWAKASEWLWRR